LTAAITCLLLLEFFLKKPFRCSLPFCFCLSYVLRYKSIHAKTTLTEVTLDVTDDVLPLDGIMTLKRMTALNTTTKVVEEEGTLLKQKHNASRAVFQLTNSHVEETQQPKVRVVPSGCAQLVPYAADRTWASACAATSKMKRSEKYCFLQEIWINERNPICETGSLLTRRYHWWFEEPRLGRSCLHDFCPEGYRCVQGKHLAYCCGEVAKEPEESPCEAKLDRGHSKCRAPLPVMRPRMSTAANSFFSYPAPQPFVPCNFTESVTGAEIRRNTKTKDFQWYFDTELEKCFEYFYEGCGGGRNTFATERDCRRCIPFDKFGCAGNAESTGSCSKPEDKCPAGSTCFRINTGLRDMAICCDDEKRETWSREVNPKCENGSLAMRSVFWGKTPLLGRSCSHKFCPDGYECVQGELLAHCCGKQKDE
ncbi:Kunitz/Bovine pancreatic trypsin inhibitor domain protein, partial [Ancylostoma caninum]